MNILVVGCGKVGSNLASVLAKQGHDVSIVDRNEENFDLLPNDFNGFKTVGVPIDIDVLKKAGIESCDAVAAVTPNDNINIMVSEVAKEIFNIENVFARIYDPNREEVFSRLGMYTICPTNLTVSTICSALNNFNTKNKTMHIGTRTLNFSIMEIPKSLIGCKVSEIKFEQDEVLYAIERDSDLMLVGLKDIELQKDDKLIFSKIVD
jgi:trk system potassium uptake protein TrkA